MTLGIKRTFLEIAHKSIQRVYLLQNWVEAQSYWAVLFAKTANAIGLLPEKRDTGNLQDIYFDESAGLKPRAEKAKPLWG
jgi:hypothetical protein